MSQLSDRLNRLAPSATLAMSQKSNEMKAQGIDVINMSVGEPDFMTPEPIKQAGIKAIEDNYSKYSPVPGYLALRQAVNESEDDLFMNNIREYIHKGDVDGARALSKQTNSPLARMIDKGLSRLGRPLSDIQAAIENEGKLEVARLEKRVSLVATVASLGPMIGFLGTVTGMVTCFQDMAHAGNNIEINTLATGMYQAMVTTIGGLIVGIICYFLYNVLVTRINKVVLDIEVRASEFMDLLHEPA